MKVDTLVNVRKWASACDCIIWNDLLTGFQWYSLWTTLDEILFLLKKIEYFAFFKNFLGINYVNLYYRNKNFFY